VTTDESGSKQRFTVKEAATRLNISEAAIRQRVQRGQMDHEKDEETGRVYILLEAEGYTLDEGLDDGSTSVEQQLIGTLQEQLRLEREASSELRRIIAGLTQRIPAVEPPQDMPTEDTGESVTPSEHQGNGTGRTDEETSEKPSWWKRFLGVE
jgi:transposase-like protein